MDKRESQFVSLISELLGPRNGIDETVLYDPRKDYVTGVLQPAKYVDSRDTMPDQYWLRDYFQEEESSKDADGTDDDLEDGMGFTSRDLSPLALPGSIGISFFLKTDSAVFDLCATWARYKDLQTVPQKWRREPHMHVLKGVSLAGVGDGTLWSSTDGVKIRSMSRKVEGGLHISIYIFNDSKFSNRLKVEDHLFQPQLRIHLRDESVLDDISIRGMTGNLEDSQHILIYRDRPTLAKGHMCGAVWKEIDPERKFDGKLPESLIPPDVKQEAFVNAGYGKDEAELFVNPTLRTDFLPSYAITQSSAGHDDLGLDEKTLNSEELARGFSSRSGMIAGLDNLKEKYGDWIRSQKTGSDYKSLDARMKAVADGNISKCSDALHRIDGGIRMIEKDEKVRLAFCFMNRTMQLQSEWGRGKPMTWKPFQMAFILQCIRGLADKTHPESRICDLLWFPTGGGKTEAYLGLLVFCLALRRLGSTKPPRNFEGDRSYGTAVITRYTLRLLTIQQFRRTLSTITACEYLRSTNWDPTSGSPRLWGNMRFSIGMWIGNTSTPASVEDGGYRDQSNDTNVVSLGAASLLMHKEKQTPPTGKVWDHEDNQPAQVMNCPCCSTILTIPKTGIDGTDHELFLTIRCDQKPDIQQDLSWHDIKVTATPVLHSLPATNYYILQLKFQAKLETNGDNAVYSWWNNNLERKLGAQLQCASADKPGYFIHETGATGFTPKEPFDIEIRCPNPSCSLNDHNWDEYIRTGNPFQEHHSPILPAFQVPNEDCALGMPIPAYLTDSQIYSRCPSVIIGTVDKFARLPFKPECGAIFGNVDRFDPVWGFYRENLPPDHRNVSKYHTQGFNPPDLIIQDELHLIEGPLGSMTGLYEAAIEALCSTQGTGPKYITSTATTRNAESQVGSLYCRELQQFPPHAIISSDNFFSKSKEAHQLDEKPAGRLYVGVCSPGRGAVSPPIRIWSSLLQNAEDLRQKNSGIIDNDLNYYWSLVGYFNATRELANFRSAYRSDVRQAIRNIASRAGSVDRVLDDSNLIELHSNMVDKNEISSVLKRLENQPIDAILATSMFGTGVDIDRLSQMVVHGQPKTTSSYIQSTGRVGRRRGAIVVTFLRSTRPRDLDHYEFFTGYHRALNKFVEPITVYPFSPRAVDRGILPVFTAILRNARNIGGFQVPEKWYPENQYFGKPKHSGCREMSTQAIQSNEIKHIITILEKRNAQQPVHRRMKPGDVTKEIEGILRQWAVTVQNSASKKEPDLFYNEIAWAKVPKFSVVMGDEAHKQDPKLRSVKDNTPQSMRNVESSVRFRAE